MTSPNPQPTRNDEIGPAAVDLMAALKESLEKAKTRREATFNPAYRVARCGQGSVHGPHVVESGPDQPRNCPGKPVPNTAPQPPAVGS